MALTHELLAAWAHRGSPTNGTLTARGREYRVRKTMPQRVILDFAQRCNLRCGFCPVWGRDPAAKEGLMDWQAALKIMDELPAGTVVSPCWYGEPLLIPDFEQVMRELKRRQFVVNLNTNGIKLRPEYAALMCDLPLDSVMFSIDAVRPATLKLVRGIWALDNIEAAVQSLMKTRGDRLYPRIGVSFTVQEYNRKEVEAFKWKWIGKVDVVRVGLEYRDGKFQGMEVPEKRVPCPLLYETMVIRHDGAVPICCLDSTCSQRMGDAGEGVSAVWNSKRLDEVRRAHERGEWDKVPFCRDCNGWADKVYSETTHGEILMRRSPQYTWYNRIDKMENWKR